MAWLCLVIFVDHCTMSFMEKKYKMPLSLVCSSQDCYQKNHKKLNKKFGKIFRLSKVARAEIQAFNFSVAEPSKCLQSENGPPFSFQDCEFPCNSLFWSLSLSLVWLNIEGWQDFSY